MVLRDIGFKEMEGTLQTKVGWLSFIKKKQDGSLDFRLFKDINSSLLAKLSWKMAVMEDNLWVKLLPLKYVGSGSFLQCKPKKNSSWGWRSILTSRFLLQGNVCFKLGDGADIYPWSDP